MWAELRPALHSKSSRKAFAAYVGALARLRRDDDFEVTVDEGTWAEVVEHGLAQGVPPAELDFEPRTVADAEALFGVTLR